MSFAPGLYRGVDEHVYHADPALSSSGARMLITQSPLDFHLARQAGQHHKREYDFGHAAHKYVTGVGSPIEVVEADSWRTDIAKAKREAAYLAGRVPLLPHEDAQARAMADVLRKHPLAGPLFSKGEAELSGWWRDPATGAMLRFRADWITYVRGRLWIVDYKTSKGAGRYAFAKAAAEFGYFMQHPYYTAGVRALGLDPAPVFIFVTQSKVFPYRVTVVQLDRYDIELGDRLNRRAIELFAECTASGIWSDDSARIHITPLPGWVRYQSEELLA